MTADDVSATSVIACGCVLTVTRVGDENVAELAPCKPDCPAVAEFRYIFGGSDDALRGES